jgi:hypothetical protein
MIADPTASLDLVPAPVFRLVALLIFGMGAFMIALHSLIVAASAQRANLPPSTRLRAPIAVAGVLALWFALAITLADAAHFPLANDAPRVLITLIALVAPIIAGIAVLFSSRTLRAINAATPSHWLVWPQLYRVLGGMFLYPFLYYGVLPGGFAWPAGVGDMLVGLFAPLVALAVARGTPRARAWAILWNVLGLIDLIVAPASALATGAAVATIYPIAIVPLFVGPPLAVLLHVFSLRNLLVSQPAARTAHREAFAA